MVNVDDTIHLCILYGINGAAILVNLLLIWIIVMRTPVAKRSYAIFLLNNAFIDVGFAMASVLGAARTISLPNGKVAFIYIGQCTGIGGIRLCNFCESLQIYLFLESMMILLLSFGYRRYIIRTGTAYVRLPPRKVVWCWCLFAYIMISPFWYLSMESLRDRSSAVARDLRSFNNNAAIAWLYNFDNRVVAIALFVVLFTPISMILMLILRKSLITNLSTMSRQGQIHHGYIVKALTYQILIPFGFLFSILAWFIDFSTFESGSIAQRFIIVLGNNIFTLASPLINLIYLPSYRKVFTNSEISKRPHII
ncbi:hypothetical protein PRIPAC_98020 [Pristionchus pacificus]|uniref:G protein-coupled receptor n=1 Tax=Pristionchus pacificus TaxID=54126 RepID=A0A2A6D1I0_PRIPA|nr:hypothetical protein PRIPAC_98020 [Pristionchus pacificus]|eukprot:PDM84240.1 G protein-coupled receptor [Pristionchus pacificus]